jgi:hypothetical protein
MPAVLEYIWLYNKIGEKILISDTKLTHTHNDLISDSFLNIGC